MLTLLHARAGQDIRGELLERMGASPARSLCPSSIPTRASGPCAPPCPPGRC